MAISAATRSIRWSISSSGEGSDAPHDAKENDEQDYSRRFAPGFREPIGNNVRSYRRENDTYRYHYQRSAYSQQCASVALK